MNSRGGVTPSVQQLGKDPANSHVRECGGWAFPRLGLERRPQSWPMPHVPHETINQCLYKSFSRGAVCSTAIDNARRARVRMIPT